MHPTREPLLTGVAIGDLRPTQITVGLREVAAKRAHWKALGKKRAVYLARHLVPVVLGPKGRPYVIDHHHLALALHDEGVVTVATTVIADLQRLERDAFWVFLDNRGWLHPFDAAGKRCTYAAIPKTLSDLVDDPYRSLAGEVREGGGYAKDATPFSEFIWADYFRRRIARLALDGDFAVALTSAMKLARSSEASFMPGWTGVHT
jgi:hypothetical protein